MNLQYERVYESRHTPGFHFVLRRVSLAQRIRFVSANHGSFQRLKFLSAAANPDSESKEQLANLEIELSVQILKLIWQGFSCDGTSHRVDEGKIKWLIEEAPAGLCLEVLESAGNELSLSEEQRKN